MPVYKAEAIVLRRTNLGEADRIVTLFCRDQGKVAAVAKGARTPKSRLSGRLELFSHVRLLLAVGRTLDVVSQVDVVHAHSLLRGDLERLGFAAFAIELTDRATADREPAPEIFESLCGCAAHGGGAAARAAHSSGDADAGSEAAFGSRGCLAALRGVSVGNEAEESGGHRSTRPTCSNAAPGELDVKWASSFRRGRVCYSVGVWG